MHENNLAWYKKEVKKLTKRVASLNEELLRQDHKIHELEHQHRNDEAASRMLLNELNRRHK